MHPGFWDWQTGREIAVAKLVAEIRPAATKELTAVGSDHAGSATGRRVKMDAALAAKLESHRYEVRTRMSSKGRCLLM